MAAQVVRPARRMTKKVEARDDLSEVEGAGASGEDLGVDLRGLGEGLRSRRTERNSAEGMSAAPSQ